MNELDYRMNYEDRKKYVYDLALEWANIHDEELKTTVNGQTVDYLVLSDKFTK
mgnify:CR=1 FL=1